MSGGSLNYLSDKIEDELFDCNVDVDYINICDDVDGRKARKMNPMHDRELSELMFDVACLLHALEWYKDCDIGEKTYIDCVNKFKKKWMNRTKKDRLNSYLEDLKSYYEELVEELKETEND